MTPTRKRRLIAISAITVGIAAAAALMVAAFQQNMLYFASPSEIAAGEVQVDTGMRVGGMVVDGSVKRDPSSLKVAFTLTDYAESVVVEYEGILPDLFREGQGIVAQGKLDASGVFIASEVLAKHDETYMPPEVADALEKGKEAASGS